MSKNKRPGHDVPPPSSGEHQPPLPPRPSRLWRIAIPLLLVAAVLVALAKRPGRDPVLQPAPIPLASHASHGATARVTGTTRTPRLVDLGADKCIPCKAMAPILVDLRTEFAGRLQVDFVDVWKDPDAGDRYKIYAIPTQIFFDGDGKELTRHEGFMSKADILATWKRFGYDFGAAGAATPES